MIIKELSALESQTAYESFLSTHIVPEMDLDQEYLVMRNDITSKYNELVSAGYKQYNLDYRFSIWFYEYMNSKEWFGERIASNYLFWNYIALKVIPDVVFDRWGDDNAQEHYYAKGLRVYPYTMYWYTHLSWQGSKEATEKILSVTKRFSTNSILHLVERPGRYYGTFIDLYRSIMKQYSIATSDKYVDYKKLFESVMKLCMAKTLVINPYLYEGGSDKFAEDLINECMSEISFEDQIDSEEPLFEPEDIDTKPADLQGNVKLKLNGNGPYSKCEFVFEVVKKFIEVTPNVTFAELKATFKNSFLGNWDTYLFLQPDVESARKWKEVGEPHKHYFIEDSRILTSSDGVNFVVCVEWDKNNLINILGLVKAFGWDYAIVNE